MDKTPDKPIDLVTSPQSSSFKTHQETIKLLTQELKNHYLNNKHLVDPDKDLSSLLDKIIKFFENDTLVESIKENEYLYQNFQKKYLESMEYIKNMTEENLKLKEQLTKAEKLNKAKYHCMYDYSSIKKSQNKSTYDDDDALMVGAKYEEYETDKKSVGLNIKDSEVVNSGLYKSTPKICKKTSSSNNDISSFNKSYYKSNSNKENHNTINNSSSNYKYQNQNIRKLILNYDKLKDEYFLLSQENNNLLKKIDELSDNKVKNIQLIDENLSLKEINKRYEESLNKANDEIKILKENLNKINNEKQSNLTVLQSVQEKLKICESEKTDINIKYVRHINKFESLQNEIMAFKKKNYSLSQSLKSLATKNQSLQDEMNKNLKIWNDEKYKLLNEIDELKEKNTNLDKEAVKTFFDDNNKNNEQNKLKFFYIFNENKIHVVYMDEFIACFDNCAKINNELSTKDSSNNLQKYFYSHINTIQKSPSYTLEKLFMNNNFTISSKSKKSQEMDLNKKNSQDDKSKSNSSNKNGNNNNENNNNENNININSNLLSRINTEPFNLPETKNNKIEIKKLNLEECVKKDNNLGMDSESNINTVCSSCQRNLILIKINEVNFEILKVIKNKIFDQDGELSTNNYSFGFLTSRNTKDKVNIPNTKKTNHNKSITRHSNVYYLGYKNGKYSKYPKSVINTKEKIIRHKSLEDSDINNNSNKGGYCIRNGNCADECNECNIF